MTQLALTHTLTPGTNEDVQDVQDNFDDILDWANGANIDSGNLTTGAVRTPELANGAVTTAKQAVVPFCRMIRASAVPLPSSAVDWSSVEHDTDSMAQTVGAFGTQPSITTPGYYTVTATVTLASPQSILFQLERGAADSSSFDSFVLTTGSRSVHSLAGMDYFSAGEWVGLFATPPPSVSYSAYMTVSWVGP